MGSHGTGTQRRPDERGRPELFGNLTADSLHVGVSNRLAQLQSLTPVADERALLLSECITSERTLAFLLLLHWH